MSIRVTRANSAPRRKGLSTEELWKADDAGLIICWEVGRTLSEKEPELAKLAKRGELPVLTWKGGVSEATKKGWMYGTHRYLATWQGLRGENLDIDPEKESELICTRTGMKVVYTSDFKKYAKA